MAQGSHSTQARLEIAPGKRLEMNLKLLPEGRVPGCPLRTRVQIVVKLLKLRFSAAEHSSRKHQQQHKKEAKAIEQALEVTLDSTSEHIEDEAEELYSSDDESVFSGESCSSSISDLSSLALSRPGSPACSDVSSQDGSDPADEEVEETELEISMDLDLETCLSRLSRWSGVFSDFDNSDLTDPARIFEYLFKCILYVMFALGRSRNYGPGSHFE